jgi:hypothetical protein
MTGRRWLYLTLLALALLILFAGRERPSAGAPKRHVARRVALVSFVVVGVALLGAERALARWREEEEVDEVIREAFERPEDDGH